MFIIYPAIFFLGFISCVICTIIYELLIKNKYWRKDSTKADIENRAHPDGKHEDEMTFIIQECPHGPMADKRDVLCNTDISLLAQKFYNITSYQSEDMSTSSVNDANDDAPHGLMATETDVVKNNDNSSPNLDYVVSNRSPDEDVIISSDKREVLCKTIIPWPGFSYCINPNCRSEDISTSSDDDANDDATLGLMASKRDVIKNNDNSSPDLDYVVSNRNPDEDVIISSDKRDVLCKTKIPWPGFNSCINPNCRSEDMSTSSDGDANDDAPRGLMATKADVGKNNNNSSSGPGYIIIDIDVDEDVTISSS
ncbi:uncharacterized protein [Dendrobates tinctorius]|uniref:uncharacterized protein n=1 Tax=Dendrobates tinctorius TaxID=92724 RepID=UPI003CCA098C